MIVWLGFFQLLLLGTKTASKNIPMFVVEQHGEVLQYWRQHVFDKQADARTFVLHIDSHSDLMDIEETILWHQVLNASWDKEQHLFDFLDQPVEQGSSLTHHQALQRYFLQNAGIGDFITRAIYSGLVSHVHWIRSDFEKGVYNGPAPGLYETRLVIQDFALTKDNQDSDQDYYEEDAYLGDAVIELCFDKLKHIQSPKQGVLLNQEPVEYFEGCSENLEPFTPQDFVLSVSTASDLIDPPFLGPPHKRWILDIDLDYFSTNDPSLLLFTKWGFSVEWVEAYFQSVFACPYSEVLGELSESYNQMRTVMRSIFSQSLNTVLLLEAALRHERPGKDSSETCSVLDSSKAQKLLDYLHLELSKTGQQNWVSMWNDNKLLEDIESEDFFIVLFGKNCSVSPMYVASEETIAEVYIVELESAIRKYMKQLGDMQPALITVSRSQDIDWYLPSERAEFIQCQTFQLIDRLFGESVTINAQFHSDVDMKHHSTCCAT